MIAALSDWTLYTDATTFWVTTFGVLCLGFSKGGMGGAFALIGVPILALVMPPTTAAALLLPLLLMMDAISLWIWRGWLDRAVLRALLPGALVGIAIGAVTAVIVSEAIVGLIVGLIAVGFTLREVWGVIRRRPVRHFAGLGWLFGGGAGFTSFVAHAGGPMFQVHVLPLRLDPRLYTGTSVVFFAVVNVVKLLPYSLLGWFDTQLLWSAIVMLPAGFASVWCGAWAVRRMSPRVFYPFSYGMVVLVGLKLIWDGVAG